MWKGVGYPHKYKRVHKKVILAESLKLHRSHRTLRSFGGQLEEKAKMKINKKLGIT